VVVGLKLDANFLAHRSYYLPFTFSITASEMV